MKNDYFWYSGRHAAPRRAIKEKKGEALLEFFEAINAKLVTRGVDYRYGPIIEAGFHQEHVRVGIGAVCSARNIYTRFGSFAGPEFQPFFRAKMEGVGVYTTAELYPIYDGITIFKSLEETLSMFAFQIKK